MKKLHSLLICVAFLLAFYCGGRLLRFLLVDDTQSYTRVMLHELYTMNDLDVLLVGSSHCYTSLNPEIISERIGLTCFNAGSSLQALDASYALIQEAAAAHDLKRVYLELYFKMALNDDYQERTDLTGTYIVSDYMRLSFRKVRFLLGASSYEYYINGFIPARRNWEKITDFAYMKQLLEKKFTWDYLTYGYNRIQNGDYGYQGRGFVAGEGFVPANGYFDSAGFDRIPMERISADWLKTLEDIIRFCHREQIELILFSAPMADFQLIGAGNYDDYLSYTQDFAAKYGVPYVDFNLCRESYLPLTSENFEDAGHLNRSGAELFSQVFADTFSGDFPNDFFYASYAEKMNSMPEKIWGISFQDEGEELRNLKIVSTLPQGTRYRFELLSGMVRDFSEDLFCQTFRHEHDSGRVVYQTPTGATGEYTFVY